MADPVSAIRALLLADAGVAGAVSGRVFGGELPAEEARAMPRAALVVSASGGVPLAADTYVEHDSLRFDVFAYGATPPEAAALLELASLVLRRARRGVWAGLLVHWVQPAGGYSDGRDPQLAWPRAFRSFQIAHSLEPAL